MAAMPAKAQGSAISLFRQPAVGRGHSSLPNRNAFNTERPLNARTVAETFRMRCVRRKPCSHFVAGAHAPSIEHQPEWINDSKLIAARILMMLQPGLDIRQASPVIGSPAFLDGRMIFFT